MENLVTLNSGLANSEDLYLLVGDIPTDRMFIIENVGESNISLLDKDKDIKARLYFKSKNNDGSFTMNSIDENPYQEHYYFSYSNGETERENNAFIGIREFLARGSFVCRQFEPTVEYYIDTLYQGNAVSLAELDIIESYHVPKLLICILGNKALVKTKSSLTSGLEFIDFKDTPLVNEKYYKFVGEKEELPYTYDEIVEGIKDDITQTIKANFCGASYK